MEVRRCRDWGSQGYILEVLDVAVPLGSALQAVASEQCFSEKSKIAALVHVSQ